MSISKNDYLRDRAIPNIRELTADLLLEANKLDLDEGELNSLKDKIRITKTLTNENFDLNSKIKELNEKISNCVCNSVYWFNDDNLITYLKNRERELLSEIEINENDLEQLNKNLTDIKNGNKKSITAIKLG
tara:strand:- start:815 stop:1210 length:396 start_codon:yes stop_codon:yes gene_type:complete